MTKSVAQLTTELAATKKALKETQEQNETLRNRPARNRFAVIIWPNKNREHEKQPPWQSTFRIPVPKGFKEGDPLWLDLGFYDYDPETCPYHFDPEGNLPHFTGSISVTDPEYAAAQEAKRVEARLKNRPGS
jgi:hypothetical protein